MARLAVVSLGSLLLALAAVEGLDVYTTTPSSLGPLAATLDGQRSRGNHPMTSDWGRSSPHVGACGARTVRG